MSQVHELSHDELEAVLGSIEIPPCPAVVTEVMAEAQKDAPDMKVLSRIIASDVGMAAFAIKLANSPLFRRGEAANSVPQAVARLGTRNIVCIVVAVALRNALSGDLPADILELFWNQAGTTAMAAGITARKLRGIQPDTAYTYGLFHNAAVPVMMRRFKDYRALMDQAARDGLILAQEENRRYHCTHAVVGGLLARNWGLPATIANAIRHHHEPDLYGPARPYLDDASLALVAVTQVAEHLLADNQGQATPECEASFEPAVAYLGLSEDDIHDLQEAFANLQS